MNTNEFEKLLDEEGVKYIQEGDSLIVEGGLDLYETDITSLPDNLSVGGDVFLHGTNITSLPDNLKVGGYLDISDTNITSLPDNLQVGESLFMEGSSITSLPDNLSVAGSLDLSRTNITSLPDNLSVAGSLYLSGTNITSLPDNLSVAGILYLDPEKIDLCAYNKNCGKQKRTIFSVFLNGKPIICSGCFKGSIEEFEIRMDGDYSGEEAEQYKASARECLVQLLAKAEEQEKVVASSMKQPRQLVVILNGPKGVGKDTVGKLLCERLGADQVQFKDRLFELAQEISGVSENDWFERYGNRELKEEPWDLLAGLSQREFLIRISEEWIKPTFGGRYFGKFAALYVEDAVNDCVFTDGGFNEECEPLLRLEDTEVFCFHLSREGCHFDSTDSRGYIGNVPQTYTVLLEEGNPEKAVEDIMGLIEA